MSSVPPKPPPAETGLRFWWVREGEQIRGPYTGRQMLAFLMRGRVKPETPIRPETERDWRPAGEDPEFAGYFREHPVPPAPEPGAGMMPGARRMPAFMILVDGEATPEERIEAILGELGPQLRLMPHVWLLQSVLPVEKILTYLVRQMSTIERLFIVDMRNGSYAFHKFGEDLEPRIARLFEPAGAGRD